MAQTKRIRIPNRSMKSNSSESTWDIEESNHSSTSSTRIQQQNLKQEKESSSQKKGRKQKQSNKELLEQQLTMLKRMPEESMKLLGLTEEQYDLRVMELEKQLGLSKQGMKSRRKGGTYERVIASKFLAKWKLKLVRTPMSGGFQKSADNESFRGDLSSLDKSIRFMLHPECKNQVTWKPKEWYDQAASDAPPDKIPIVIMHRPQKIVDGKRTEEADDFVMLRLDDFLEIADQSKLILKSEE